MEVIHQPQGASEEEVAELEAAYAARLPVAMRRLWLNSNGPIFWYGFKELQFLSVADILADPYSVREQMPNALPLCLDGNSNLCVARIEGNGIEGFYVANCSNLGWDDAKRIASSFEAFLEDHVAPEARLYV